VMSESRGDVVGAGEAVQADHEVAHGGHDLWGGTGADLDWSSAKVTSRTQCSPFSICQCPRIQAASSAGRAWCGARLVIA
jgi:hypothetical protein